MSTLHLREYARSLGCPEILSLDSTPAAEHLDYLDLMPGRLSRGKTLPHAVAEFQGHPLLYLVDISRVSGGDLTAKEIVDLQALLANRGEHACLGIVRPGSLDVYPINFSPALAKTSFKTVQLEEAGAPGFFQALATGSFELSGQPDEADYVFNHIHNLLTQASEALAGRAGQTGRMRGLDVLSTTGRALFFRFLIDREIIRPSEVSEICPGVTNLRDAFSNAENAAATSFWLDETFNGDLLPLVSADERLTAYRDFYRQAGHQTDQSLFLHLDAILKGWKNVGGGFQTRFDWDDFDFAYIPIGVLSQVYESFSHQWDEDKARSTSVHYTPRHLARMLVEESFAGLQEPAAAIVLDPACGAGVFLVLAFRQLVRECWKKHGTRPDTRAIQRILYTQLRGFDISESALRLAALALYITAIEVNGTQRPPKSLKFPDPLRDRVLFHFGDDKPGFTLGSLGADVPATFNQTFDIVVTNPPWTRLRAKGAVTQKQVAKLSADFTAISRRALIAAGCESLAAGYTNPDNNPDLPFLWRASEWARPGGIIAMALPGRIILKQDGKGKAARDAILQGLTVTGILNGSDLEKTPVWPKMDLPFMLLFARNSRPNPGHRFHFMTPVRENVLSKLGKFRLDYKSAEMIEVQAVVEQPWLLKALAVGTVLDVDVIEKLPQGTIGEFWEANDLYSGLGYNLSTGLSQQLAGELYGTRDFEESGFSISLNLPTWGEKYQRTTAHLPRSQRLYQPPLVIVPEAQRESRFRPKAFLSLTSSLAFSKSYYGYSSSGASSGIIIAVWLYLLLHSKLFQYVCLLKSSRQGASFRTILKEDIDAFPYLDSRQFPPDQRRKIAELAEALQTQDSKPWDEIDDLIFKMYGLNDDDAMVVRDTVAVCGPYRPVREHAEHPVSAEILSFASFLEDMLQPLFDVTGQRIEVRPVPQSSAPMSIPAWEFLSVTLAGTQPNNWNAILASLMFEASSTGASRIVLRIPEGGLVLGILNQRRFWTRSRAWLCSLHIEQHHLDAFPVPAS